MSNRINRASLDIAMTAFNRIVGQEYVLSYAPNAGYRVERQNGSCPFGTARRNMLDMERALWFAIDVLSVVTSEGK